MKSLTTSGIRSKVHYGDIDTLGPTFPANSIIFTVNLNCPSSKMLLVSANKNELFASPYRWLIISKAFENEQVLNEYFAEMDILVDSEFTLAEFILEEKNYKLRTIFKREPMGLLVQEELGYFEVDRGLVIVRNESAKAIRRKNLMGTVLNTCIVITNNDSLNHLTDKRDRHIDTISKVNYVLVEHLSNFVNASLNYSIQPSWGYRDNNSKWSGMIGELTRKEAVIGGTALFLTSDRVSEIDYIAMTSPTKSKFVFRQPKLSYVTNVYTLPFHWSVWVSTATLLVVIAVLLHFVVKWEWHKKKSVSFHNESNQSELDPNWLECIFLAVGALCQQGTAAVPYGLPGRIITILLFISVMFLYTSYSANIVALLQSSSNSIKTLSDLLHSRLAVGVDDTVFNHFYFPNATEPVRRALYLQKVAPPGQRPRYFPIAEGVRRMREGLFAFHMEAGAGYKIVGETFTEAEKCGLQEISFLQVPDPWLAVQKNTSYKEMFKIGLRLIHESGLQPREVSLLYTKKPQCTSRGNSFVSVGIIDCYAPAAVFAGGIFAATIVFLLEIYGNYRVKYYKKKLRRFRNVRFMRKLSEGRWPYID